MGLWKLPLSCLTVDDILQVWQILDEADTMFDQGFAPEVRKFLRPLRNRASNPGDNGFQIVLVTATITKACPAAEMFTGRGVFAYL